LQNGNKQADYTEAGNFMPTERLSAFQEGLFHRRTSFLILLLLVLITLNDRKAKMRWNCVCI